MKLWKKYIENQRGGKGVDLGKPRNFTVYFILTR